ncbi:MAG TPA: selenocysteine-specific translation elongation factor [Steroidobacteraceae bacterium]|nr:selenocysteine-specific translation elongation factor [Steroidobacteraceae bacterium]
MIVGTAGHIDHGKTSLVRALSGVDTDRLKEEKARGISIELGYAYTPLACGEVLGYVDVPGHERLIHTMVAGVGGIDCVLLVIAADDGIMPQTREHLSILEFLGVQHGIVALTKIDRVDVERVATVQGQIASCLKGGPLASASLFPLIATARDDPGVAALRAHLHAMAASWPLRRSDGLFRLAVDRVFTLPGRGTVITGMARAGQVRVGDELALMPSGRAVRVRSIHAQNREAGYGRAGERCALALAGVDRAQVARGDWLADPRALAVSTRIDVQLRALPGAARVCDRAPIHVHLGTAHQVARAVILGDEGLSAGERGTRMQLVFDAPMCAAPGDLFIVRDAQASHTLGGGVVLDPWAPARRRRSPRRLAHLTSIEELLRGEGIAALLREAPHGVSLLELVALCGTAPEHIPIPSDARLVDAGSDRVVILETHWRALRDRALSGVRRFHAEAPDEPGIDQGRLRRMSAPDAREGLWRTLIAELLEQGVLQQQRHWLHLPEHRVSLSESEARLAKKLLLAIARGGFDPPWVRDLAVGSHSPEDEVRRVLRKCAVLGQLHQIVRDLFYEPEQVRLLAQIIERLAKEHGSIETACYRDAIAVGRKRAIQILEFFDRVGYTRRVLDARILRTDSSWREHMEPQG